ncbi:uncharacterized protein LOC126745100 [Anthonomus grandis grandis]|uniref:uncharacterized protein LOC126745100 n=1 Tax=Anthonomus grandis grandis TaxID=2921223 RepID=UPI002165D090|nr:uncharacterized protein LOC126745100 [Anthonomus grandis grandis]
MSKNKPLSYEELVALAEEMLDREYLSDYNGQDELSYEELVALAEEMLDREYLSDDNGQDENGQDENEDINEILDNNDMNELLDRQEDEIVDGLEEHQENTEDVSEQVIVGESSVRDVINVRSKESTISVTEFFLENDLTMKKNIRWRRNVTYLTPPIPRYKKNVEQHVTLESPLYF